MYRGKLVGALVLPLSLAIWDPARSALAPQFDRWFELQRVMADESIPRKLWGHGAVERIEARPGGVYRVWAARCYVDATVKTETNGRRDPPGHQSISGLSVGEVRCP